MKKLTIVLLISFVGLVGCREKHTETPTIPNVDLSIDNVQWLEPDPTDDMERDGRENILREVMRLETGCTLGISYIDYCKLVRDSVAVIRTEIALNKKQGQSEFEKHVLSAVTLYMFVQEKWKDSIDENEDDIMFHNGDVVSLLALGCDKEMIDVIKHPVKSKRIIGYQPRYEMDMWGRPTALVQIPIYQEYIVDGLYKCPKSSFISVVWNGAGKHIDALQTAK